MKKVEQQNQQEQRSIPQLIQSAKAGDIKAQYQLAKNYQTGKFVEEADESKVEYYLSSIFERRLDFNPKFKSLELIGFRGFKNQKVIIDPKLTVFVGNNGAGKTSIIEAFCMSSSWITALIKNSNNSGVSIELDDINNSSNVKNAHVITTINAVDDIDYKLHLSKSKTGILPQLTNILLDIKQLASIYSYFNTKTKDDKFNLPLFAYYSVGRSTEIKKLDFKYASEHMDTASFTKLDGYTDSFDESKSFRQFLTWLTRFESIEGSRSEAENKAEKDTWQEIIELRAKVETITSFLELLPEETKEDKKLEILSHESKIQFLQQKVNKTVTITQIVKQAIYDFMPNVENIRIHHSATGVDLLMEKDSVTINALQLSQGEKSLLALVGDIARRLLMLNPSNTNTPLDGKGIVIIDEIDLHLHPKWQQLVIQQLCDTFKNIQFILTTHSPQVLSTVPADSIRIIQKTEQGLEIKTPDFSLGSESKMILEEILGVPSRPENIEEVKDLIKYQKLISLDQWDSPDALKLHDKLVAWAGTHDPILLKLDMDIRLRKRRRAKK